MDSSVIDNIKQAHAKADDEGRRQIQDGLSRLQDELDTEYDAFARLVSGPMKLAIARIGINLGIFKTLQQSEAPVKVEHLAEKTGSDPELMARIVRSLAAFGLVEEVGQNKFTKNNLSKMLAQPNPAGAVEHLSDVPGNIIQVLPEFLAARKYQNITSNKETGFQMAYKTDSTIFEYMLAHPEHLATLGHLMAMERPTNWVDAYPVEEEMGDFATANPSAPVIVDVGGGFGQQAVAFRAALSHLDLPASRVVVQDIPQTLASAPRDVEGVTFMAHDFFTPQPVRGAKFYYLRHVLHDWPEEQCLQILEHLVRALGPESRIVVDEVVLPDVGVPWQSAYMDLLMCTMLGGAERTRSEWYSLLGRAGLEIVEIRHHHKMQAAIVTVPKK